MSCPTGPVADGRSGSTICTTSASIRDERENRVGEAAENDMVEMLRTALVDVEAPAEQLQRLGLT